MQKIALVPLKDIISTKKFDSYSNYLFIPSWSFPLDFKSQTWKILQGSSMII